MTQYVKNDIHICICRICLLQLTFIFIFVHQKNYSVHSDTHILNVFLTPVNPSWTGLPELCQGLGGQICPTIIKFQN